mgnify:CR=1 FL=1
MKEKRLREAVESMAAMPGLEGCALVEIEAGMVWHHAGHIDRGYEHFVAKLTALGADVERMD